MVMEDNDSDDATMAFSLRNGRWVAATKPNPVLAALPLDPKPRKRHRAIDYTI
jgi:hypothetical protein